MMEMKARSKLLRMYKLLSMALHIIFQIYWYKWTRKSEAEKIMVWHREKIPDNTF